MDTWQPDFLSRLPLFEPLRKAVQRLPRQDRWPNLEDYEALLEPPIFTAGGARLRFVAQDGKPRSMADKYEARIFLKGEVQTRTENWHDYFNALVWRLFPKTKAALNACHQAALEALDDPLRSRGRIQDALTLFDESGIVVAYWDDDLAAMLREFQWKELFWRQRQRVAKGMKFVVFGHSLYEKALAPYLGFTAKGLLIKVEPGFLALPEDAQLEALDGLVSARFDPHGPLPSSRDLTPVPLLGIPGWWDDNEAESFYDNAGYFRPKPAARS